MAAPCDRLEISPHETLIDICRIVGFAVPHDRLPMLFVGRVEHGLKKLHESPGAAHVLRWAAAGAVDKDRVVDVGRALANLLDCDLVLPVVSEVIEVVEPSRSCHRLRMAPWTVPLERCKLLTPGRSSILTRRRRGGHN